MFVPPESLPFSIAEIMERSISDWYIDKPPPTPIPEVESVGDFIVAELNRRRLRYFDGHVAHFESDAGPEEYRESVFAALDRWLAEVQRERTAEEREAYRNWDESSTGEV
jgi:hypothetical protein